MAVRRIAASQAAATLDEFDAVIDARSESEFAEDHLPGAINWPTLSDAERHDIGTLYAQSPFEARKRGAVLASRNIAAHIERIGPTLARDWRPLVYCWRGGQRSGSLALVLDSIGWPVSVLEGGYREFRRHVLHELEDAGQGLRFVVLCGPTGSGKSRLLQALADSGQQVLDLEALARHRGSVLGDLPDQPQPTQKAFDRVLWQTLARLDRSRTVYVESESRVVGRIRLPAVLWERMRASPCLRLETPLAARVSLLLEDYDHLVRDPELLCRRLEPLRMLRGASTVDRWQALARTGRIAAVVEELLVQHYDPLYERSMHSHFADLLQAPSLALDDARHETLIRAARQLSREPERAA